MNLTEPSLNLGRDVSPVQIQEPADDYREGELARNATPEDVNRTGMDP